MKATDCKYNRDGLCYCDRDDIDTCLAKDNDGCIRPLTNAERIRGMTDDELAKLLVDSTMDNLCEMCGCLENMDCDCQTNVLNWLKQPWEGV